MCAVLLLPRVLFFVHGRERVRAACVAPTERQTERERGGGVARVCEHNTKMEREEIFKERIK